MSWRLRHEGSPQPIAQPLTTEQIVEGLKDGVYATTDEVRGPSDSNWVRLENHPYFAEVSEVIQDIESEATHEADDNNIDMNPLIDVCLVLLVFFILATTMSVMERVMRLPANQKNDQEPRVLPPELTQKYIMLRVEKKGAATQFKVNEYVADDDDKLLRELERLVREGKTELILDIGPGVDFGSYTKAVEKAGEARVTRILTKAVAKPGKRGAGPPAKAAAPVPAK